jgi:hypothetical protein
MSRNLKANKEMVLALLLVTDRKLRDLVEQKIIPPPNEGEYNIPMCVKAYIAHLQREIDSRTPNLCDARVVGEYLGMTDRGVRKAVDEGRMPKVTRGVYDLKACVQAYAEHLRRRASGEAGTSMDEESLLLKREQRLRAEFERRIAERDYVPAEECKEGWIVLSRMAVNAIESLVSRLATSLDDDARESVMQEARRQREELASELAQITDSLCQAGE